MGHGRNQRSCYSRTHKLLLWRPNSIKRCMSIYAQIIRQLLQNMPHLQRTSMASPFPKSVGTVEWSFSNFKQKNRILKDSRSLRTFHHFLTSLILLSSQHLHLSTEKFHLPAHSHQTSNEIWRTYENMGNERNQRCRQLRTWQCSKRTNHKIKLCLSTYVRFSNFVLCFLVQKPTTSTRAILLHNVELVAHTCPRLQKPDSTNKQLWSLNNNNQVTFSHSTSLFTGELYISTSTHQKDIKISTTNEAMGHERNQRSCHTRTRQHP